MSAPSFMIPMSAPEVPATMDVTTPVAQATPITTASVSWTAPASNQGSALTGYMVEWYATEQIKEVQTIETAMTSSGSFNLALDGISFGQITHDISAVQLRHTMMTTPRLSISAISQIVVDAQGIAAVSYTAPSSIRAGEVVTIMGMDNGGEFANMQWTVHSDCLQCSHFPVEHGVCQQHRRIPQMLQQLS